MAAAVVEFDALADPVRTAPQDHHLAAELRLHFALRGDQLQGTAGIDPLEGPLIGGVVIRGAGGKFSRTGIHGFEHRIHAQTLAMGAHLQLLGPGGPANLPIGKTQLLELQEAFAIEIRQRTAAQQPALGLHNPPQLGEEPGING